MSSILSTTILYLSYTVVARKSYYIIYIFGICTLTSLLTGEERVGPSFVDKLITEVYDYDIPSAILSEPLTLYPI